MALKMYGIKWCGSMDDGHDYIWRDAKEARIWATEKEASDAASSAWQGDFAQFANYEVITFYQMTREHNK